MAKSNFYKLSLATLIGVGIGFNLDGGTDRLVKWNENRKLTNEFKRLEKKDAETTLTYITPLSDDNSSRDPLSPDFNSDSAIVHFEGGAEEVYSRRAIGKLDRLVEIYTPK